MLGESFIKVHRSCLVDAARIHHISNVSVLNSGEKITYAKRQKAAIVSRLCVLRGETPDCFVRSTPLPVGRRKTKPAPPTASMPETIPIAEQEEPIQKEAIQKEAIQKVETRHQVVSMLIRKGRTLLQADMQVKHLVKEVRQLQRDQWQVVIMLKPMVTQHSHLVLIRKQQMKVKLLLVNIINQMQIHCFR